MDELLGRVGGRFKISLTDSTMLEIVHSAMDKAHERAQSKEGVIERLTEISKFYELAVMQLEGCLRFVQEETDSTSEISNEEVLWDLTDIRDRLVGRIEELELAIAEKDREFVGRVENEVKFRKVLEMKQRELDSLYAKLKLEPFEYREDLGLGNKGVIDELVLGDEEFSGLKNSVDKQVWNIKHKLEPEDRRRNRSCDSLKIEQMGSDIDILKETMDLAFGKMRGALFFSDKVPVEQQWRSSIEKDALSILINGFVRDIQENFKVEIRGREKKVSFGLSEHLSDLMKEIKCLNDDLEALCVSQSNHESKITPKPKEPEVENHSKPQNSTLRIAKAFEQKQVAEENKKDDASNLVAKLIRNHESFIKRKTEVNKLKQENTEEKDCLPTKREGDIINPRRKIQDVITRMENLINWNAKLGDGFSEDEGTDGEESYLTQQQKSHINCAEEGQEKEKKIHMCNAVNEELHKKIGILQEEKQDASLQIMVTEKICAAFLEGFIDESIIALCSCDLEMLIRESMHKDLLEKTVNELNEHIGSDQINFQIREDIHYTVFREAMEEFGVTLDSAMVECLKARAEIFHLVYHNIEGKLREEMLSVSFAEICKERNEFIERSGFENVIGEEIYRIVLEETHKNITSATDNMICNFKEDTLEGKLTEEIFGLLFGELCKEWTEVIERSSSQNHVGAEINEIRFEENLGERANTDDCFAGELNEVRNLEDCICGFHSTKEDVYRVYLGEMLKEWKEEINVQNFEHFIRQEIFQLAITEVLKEGGTSCREAMAEDHPNVSEDFISGNKLVTSKVDHKKDLIQNRENKLDKLKISQDLFTEMGCTFTSVSTKVEKALEQLAFSKEMLDELRSCIVRSDDWTHNKVNLILPYSEFTHIMQFLQVLMDFKCRVDKKLELNIFRLEEALHYLNQVVELVTRQRRKEWQYRKAFISRCENLRMAETEVDLLGDQVEVLQGLLEKIYDVLNHYSPVLGQYFEVSDILNMIRKELIGDVHATTGT